MSVAQLLLLLFDTAAARRFPQRVYLPFTMSSHHWRRHTSSSTSQQQTSSATAISRSQQLSSLLSGPSLGPLPEFVAALDKLTYPVQRLNAWKAVWGPLVNSVADKAHTAVPAALMRLWQEEVYPDLVTGHKQAGGAGMGVGSRLAGVLVCCYSLAQSLASVSLVPLCSAAQYAYQPLCDHSTQHKHIITLCR